MSEERKNYGFSATRNAIGILEKHGEVVPEHTFPTIGIICGPNVGSELREASRILSEAGFVTKFAFVEGVDGVEVTVGTYVYRGVDALSKLIDPDFVPPQPANPNDPLAYKIEIF